MTTASEVATAAPAPVSVIARFRRRCRWVLLAGFVLGMSVWALSFSSGTTSLCVVLAGFWLWLLWGLGGLLAKVFEVAATRRGRMTWRAALPSWGTLLWFQAPWLWLGSNWIALDARVWLLLNEGRVTAIADAMRSEDLPQQIERDVDGYRVIAGGDSDVVWFASGAWFLDTRGIAHDPGGVLRAGPHGEQLARVVDLGGPWRYWYESD